MPKLMIYCDDFTIHTLTNVAKDRCIQAQFGLEIQCIVMAMIMHGFCYSFEFLEGVIRGSPFSYVIGDPGSLFS